MASANVLSELTAQLNSKEQGKNSETNASKASSGNSKPSPGPKPTNHSKSNAEEITVVESKPDTSDNKSPAQDNKKKQRKGFFSRVKQFVKRPSKNKSNSKENNRRLDEKQRTQSTSDLDYDKLAEEDETNRRLSLGSDSPSGVASGTESHESDQKQKHGAHGVAKFFGRKMKLRSSWKSKFKVVKKNESASEPVSPVEQKPRKHIQQNALQKDDDIKEEISTISAVFADDSFFQVSLIENEDINEKQLEQSLVFSDISEVNETTPSSRNSAAQDKLRVAPRGRRRPTRYNSQGSVVNKTAEKIEIVSDSETNPIQTTADVTDTRKYSNSKPVKMDDSITEEISNDMELSDTVIIKTPEDRKILSEKSQHQVSSDDEFGSWEHLSKSKSNTSLKKEESPLPTTQKDTVIREEEVISAKSVSSHSPEGESRDKTQPEKLAQVETNVSKPNNILQLESKENENKNINAKPEVLKKPEIRKKEFVATDNSKAEGKHEDESDKKEEAASETKMKIHENIEFEKEKVVQEKQEETSDLKNPPKKESKEDVEKLQTVFDAIISRTKSIEEELAKVDKKIPGSKKDVSFDVKTEEKSTHSNSVGRNISFDMNDLDDIRSADLQPASSFQRSYSLSAAAKPIPPAANFSKSVSTEKMRKTSNDEKDVQQTKPSVPDWVAIAKAKHRRNTIDDENESEEEEIKKDENAKHQPQKDVNEKQSPPVKEKPFADKKGTPSFSKIPKPSFKSQSFKETRSNQPMSKLPSRSAKSVKATSPVSVCIVCDKPAHQHERCDIDGQVAHKNCAKCSMCSRTINVGTIQVINGKLYCGIHVRNAAR